MVQVVVRASHASNEILKRVLTETPLILDEKLVRGACGEATRPLVIDGGLN